MSETDPCKSMVFELDEELSIPHMMWDHDLRRYVIVMTNAKGQKLTLVLDEDMNIGRIFDRFAEDIMHLFSYYRGMKLLIELFRRVLRNDLQRSLDVSEEWKLRHLYNFLSNYLDTHEPVIVKAEEATRLKVRTKARVKSDDITDDDNEEVDE